MTESTSSEDRQDQGRDLTGIELAVHQTRLASWVVNTLGKALLIAVGVGFVLMVIGFLVSAPEIFPLIPLATVLTLALVLLSADAPLPPGVRKRR